ncbi:MAG: 1-acyl-sn-glycerol-3-phosphate acyltransferase [Rhodocyclaceae bacterium]|nr:MAG: 1-acyl-sn-glycerol-3-phosphate acyltransferase [Gammaproteobacteria bacterium]TXG79448.1 MAG: 1-acyl-sn-glycerol-3-phosphate acyltransferase [Rhodocyclaceae bacterium]
MNSTADSPETMPRKDAWRPLRYLVRTPFVLLHVFVGLPVTVLALSPPLASIPVGKVRLGHFMTSWWSGTFVRLFGFRIRVFGKAQQGAVMYVANHLSWLDIELMHSQRAISFVAKSEIERWPVVGWLATRGGTIYHRRGSNDSMANVVAQATDRLRDGLAVGIFPEGGTGRGDTVRTFHARIFQAALDAGVPVQPVALRYGRNGRQDLSMPFAPKEPFFVNLLRVLGNPAMDAEVHFLEVVEPAPDARRRMAEQSRARIVDTLGYGDP